MNRINPSRKGVLFALVVTAMLSLAAPTALAQIMVTQKPCSTEGACLQFTANDEIPVIRRIRFDAPSAGSAIVSFHGSLRCGGPSTQSGSVHAAQLILESAISTRRTEVVKPDNPGGLRHASSMSMGNSFIFETTFNLASTRLVDISAAGPQNYFFMIRRTFQEPGITCTVYNAVFTVQFVP